MYDQYDVYWVVDHLLDRISGMSSTQPDTIVEGVMTWKNIDLGNGVVAKEFNDGQDGEDGWNNAVVTIDGIDYRLSMNWTDNDGEIDPHMADCDDGLIEAAVSIWPKILTRDRWWKNR